MIQTYPELIRFLDDNDLPYHTLTLQYSFILYLVLGQVALLLLWRLVLRRGDRPASWRRHVAFALYLLLGQAALFAAWPPLLSAWLSADRVLLADIVVTFHLGLVLAVLAALVLILVGWPLGWRWTRSFWFRLAQLLVIEVVAGQAVVGIECPLKTAERELRGGGGAMGDLDNASAVGRWSHRTLYFTDPKYIEFEATRVANLVGSRSPNALTTAVMATCVDGAPMEGLGRVFMVAYLVVGLLTLATWVLVPPRLPWEPSREAPPGGSSPAAAKGEGARTAEAPPPSPKRLALDDGDPACGPAPTASS